MTLDELLLEWSYRSEKGYPSLDSPSDISLLKEILKKLKLPEGEIDDLVDDLETPGTDGMEDSPVEKAKEKTTQQQTQPSTNSFRDDLEKFDDELDKEDIDPCTEPLQKLEDKFRQMVARGDIDPSNEKQITKFLNRCDAFVLYDPLKKLLTDKGFSSLIFKDYAKQIRDLTEDETDGDRKIFNDYLKNPSKQINLPQKTRGNLQDEMKRSGLPRSIIKKLITHTAQDQGKKGVGMGELALAIVFKNITDSLGRGDLGLNDEYLEVKAQNATLGKKPDDFKTSLENVKRFEEFGLKRELIPNKKGTGSSLKLTFNEKAYNLDEFTTIIPLMYQATTNKDGLKNLIGEVLLDDGKHSAASIEYGLKDMDLTDAQSVQSAIGKTHFYNYIEEEGFLHFLAHDMGKKSKKGVVEFVGEGEYIYVSVDGNEPNPGEMADKLMDAGATFQKSTFNNWRPRIGFGEGFI